MQSASHSFASVGSRPREGFWVSDEAKGWLFFISLDFFYFSRVQRVQQSAAAQVNGGSRHDPLKVARKVVKMANTGRTVMLPFAENTDDKEIFL